MKTRAIGSGMVALALGGCVSLLPAPPPTQLYRFGPDAAEAPPDRPPAPGPGVVLAEVSLPAASTGDQILTLTGDRAAYVAGARWVTPAVQMFREDAERAFAERARRVRLLHRGEIAAAAAVLRLDVADFEVRYAAADAPPAVVVSLRANLARADGGGLQQRGFTARQAAAENRVSAIVRAFDVATARVLGQVVAWTDAAAPGAPQPAGVPATTTTSATTAPQ